MAVANLKELALIVILIVLGLAGLVEPKEIKAFLLGDLGAIEAAK
jgi:hypothetical protein